jgi:hypothetical protein
MVCDYACMFFVCQVLLCSGMDANIIVVLIMFSIFHSKGYSIHELGKHELVYQRDYSFRCGGHSIF